MTFQYGNDASTIDWGGLDLREVNILFIVTANKN